jgi:hypothetical protein
MTECRCKGAMLAMVVAGVTASACISHAPRRTFDSLDPGSNLPEYCGTPQTTGDTTKNAEDCGVRTPHIASDSVCTSIPQLTAIGAAGDLHRQRVSCVSHERHEAVEKSATFLPHAGFDLHVLEFDDEGQPWNRDLQDRTFEVIRQQLSEPAVVLGFVHGWKNDASVCNGNLSCFRDVLEILAKAETAFSMLPRPADAGVTTTPIAPRRVVGVYFGWRGGTIKTRGIKQVTFWGRKHTAHTIGDNGGVTNAIERLRAMVINSRGSGVKTPGQALRTTSLVMVGHSFGGALLYSALATSLNAAVGEAIQKAPGAEATRARAAMETGARRSAPEKSLALPAGGGDTGPVEVDSSGDLVVLVNPAMEASRFANLHRASKLQFTSTQVPIFVTLASEGDSAVGGFFPIGQAFSTIARSARSREIWFSMVKGFGLYEPYHTHRLVLKPATDVPEREEVSGECRCKSNMGKFGDPLVTRLLDLYKTLDGTPDEEMLRLAGYQEMLYSRLEPVRDVDPNNPFIMASVDPAVVADHNDIFNPRFVDFLIEFVVRSELKRGLSNQYGQRRLR